MIITTTKTQAHPSNLTTYNAQRKELNLKPENPMDNYTTAPQRADTGILGNKNGLPRENLISL